MDTQKKIPTLATRLLKLFLREELVEEVIGDLNEKFQKTAKEKSPFRAHINYWFQVLNYIRLFALKKKQNERVSLVKNNIKISWRHLRKQPMFSFINVGGLTLGITACILITIYIKHELSFDQQLAGKNIFRLYTQNNNDGTLYQAAWHSPPLADVLRNEVPEIKNIARIYTGNITGSSANEISRASGSENPVIFYEEGFIYADPSIIDILNINVLQGNSATALSEPMTMVITERKAEKYFPGENPVGKLMTIGNDTANPYRIDAVVVNPPANSHLQYDFILTKTKHERSPGESQIWHSTGFYNSYVELHDNADVATACAKMTDVAKNYMLTAWSPEFLREYTIGLQPVEDIHLYSGDMRAPVSTGDIVYVWIFGVVAIFILVIACINFINLSTAKSANRAKEVGLRKTVGSTRGYIVVQFITESVLISGISFTCGAILAWLLLPQFNRIAGAALGFPWNQLWFFSGLTACSVVIGIIAGLYPALYLSSFKPVNVLKGSLARGAKGSALRSTLVVFQFTASIILIISTIVIYKQIDFMLNRKTGFDKEQVLLLHGTKSITNPETLKQELLRLPGVQNVTISEYMPVTGSNVPRSGKPFWFEGAAKDSDTQTRAQQWSVDCDYIKTMGMKIVEGRDFNPDIASDSNAIIINQQMAKDLRLDDPVGQQVTAEETWTIIGVVENFNFESLRSEIRSLGLVLRNSPGTFSIRITAGNMTSTVASVESIWHQFAPNQPIRYTFLDDDFASMYDDVRRTGNIFTGFSIMAMIVACLGLFALSAFMIEQRAKEISIRLLFGATVQKIFRLLTADFLKLVLVSIVLSLPTAAWMAKRWLEEFRYRIELTWDVFVATGLVAIVIALITVSYQSVKAGLVKPVNNLRPE